MLLPWWCPSEDKLQEYVVHPRSGWIERHLARCDKCRSEAHQIQEDEQFLAQCRAAAQDCHFDLGNHSFTHLMDTCRKAQIAAEQQRPRG